jgi:hypothetical protein
MLCSNNNIKTHRKLSCQDQVRVHGGIAATPLNFGVLVCSDGFTRSALLSARLGCTPDFDRCKYTTKTRNKQTKTKEKSSYCVAFYKKVVSLLPKAEHNIHL